MNLVQENIKKIFSKENKIFFVKYLLISILGYLFIFLSLFILIDFLKMNKTISFLIVYAINYLFLYVVQLKYLFNTSHHKYKLIRFITFILFFYICANLIYNLGLMLHVNYLISTALTIVILMPFRLITSKLIVFKD